MTTGPDTLLQPLTPTRECLYSDDPRAEVVREIFCTGEWHVRFVRGLLIFSDYLDGRPNAVMGASQTTAVLFHAAEPYSHVDRVLDLGCGAGTLGLFLRAKATSVIATDINARAVEFTQFNSRLNSIPIDVREGDLFEPVRGEQFDLIVSQPPYYPGGDQTFLHGGPTGMEVTLRILADVRQYLTDDGMAILHTAIPLSAPTPEGVVEYTPEIGEIEGTRHSLLVLGRDRVSTERIDISPDQWGRIVPGRPKPY